MNYSCDRQPSNDSGQYPGGMSIPGCTAAGPLGDREPAADAPFTLSLPACPAPKSVQVSLSGCCPCLGVSSLHWPLS